ncbi:gonadotropin-releasing hormone II receptor-like [Stegostoma tigrinum]|uniref:gonadotropin-releasing hormone II receptor-like n=1 Tax=Stegostoma tigrinum TaxID=3053191 RepID=UPI00202B9791|nr:gonadotropin-releasing hormone II receptor-like [Stegostoma tigrinum]
MKLRLLCCNDLLLCNSSAVNSSLDSDGSFSTTASDQGGEDELLLPTFSTASKVRVVITLTIFLISSYLNLTVLCDALRRRGTARSHIRTLIVNLSCADLLVTFIVMPLDAAWNITVQWYAGDPACKLLMFLKLLSMYSCAFITVVISLDRYCAILHPLGISRANERNRIMLIWAWIMSVILATPQLFLFHSVSIAVPAPFTQCVTHGSFKESWQEKVYFLFTFLWLFLLPLLIMVFCYTSIIVTITRKMAVNADVFSKDADSRCSKNYIPKVRMKTLKMTIVLVSTFIIYWTPYYVLGFWYNFFPAMINKKEIPESINHALFTFGMLNSLVDPLVCRIGYLRLTNS